MSRNFAVVLSGCGVFDGAEIHEAVLTLLAIDKLGGRYACFAPNIPQAHVVDHLRGEPTAEQRNVLVESARIARGKVFDLATYDTAKFDALVFPGGFGAAKNLCTFAFDGAACTVDPSVERAIRSTHEAGKPIGALCISPVLLARVLGDVEVTIGSDAETAAAIGELGGKHRQTTHGEVTVDARHKLVTTPCYMLDATISQIARGAENVIMKLFELTR